MEHFWKWLMRANARTLFIGALLALIGVAGWWVWKEIYYREPGLRAPAGVAARENRPPLGILEFIEHGLTRPRSAAVTNNPFLPFGGSGEIAKANPNPRPVEVKTPPPVEPREPLPAPKKFVSLTYRGMFRLPDGKNRVLIEDSVNKRTAFYKEGDLLFGLAIESASMTDAVVRVNQDTAVHIGLGQPTRFEEDAHDR